MMMRVWMWWGCMAAVAAAQDAPQAAWPLYNKGVRWQKSLEDARALARKEGKLVLYYLNTGDLDKDAST